MSTIKVGDRVTITEPGGDPYDAEILAIIPGPEGTQVRIRAYLPYETPLEIRPGVRIVSATTGGDR
ncbi:hypothetical protein [Nocardiopsis sp. YSL2]|uniref:hypothetical protein n=1 Tax=Nocardiopsis sp. YSL2 TaxID=2939492 RepID=UPI0026F40CEB|nr:hypothetical protein [Nocardiopsis sp. YSL2]